MIHHYSRRHGNRAFTLIEMLVVMGIIAILSGIIFSAYAQVRESGRQITCTSNIRQLGIAFMEYIQDNDETYPKSGQHYGTPVCMGSPDGSWVLPEEINTSVAGTCTPAQLPVPNGALFPYVKSTKIFKCPSDKYAEDATLSYSMNSNLSAMLLVKIRAPAGCVLLVDESGSLNNGNFLAPPSDDTNGYPNYTDLPTTRHNGMAMFAYADGHVKSSRPPTIKTKSYDPATP
jgi:prepilin-type N-terminal cleavage/methylation domain-containing protein/prepilin-type processing-associated H-X9-DG protein